jgi:hypothetical protein
LELALIFHCDPYAFLQRPATEVADLYRRTSILLAKRKQEETED